MMQLFKKDITPQNTTDFVTREKNEDDVKLLSFGMDFSEQLRQNHFCFQKNIGPIENRKFYRAFSFIQQNRLKTKLLTFKIDHMIVVEKKPDEFALIRSLLIEVLVSGLDTIWPILRQNEVLDLEQSIDEVDNIEMPSKEIVKSICKTESDYQRFRMIMGPVPVLDATFVDEDGITIEIIVSTHPKRFRSSNSIYKPSIKDRSVRFVKRANLIINTVRKERILTFFCLKKIVLQSEAEEGFEYQIDKRSLLNVIRVVISEGFIKAYKVIIATQEQCFICSLDVQADDGQLKEVIDSLKMKLLLPTTVKHTSKVRVIVLLNKI